MSLLYHLRPLNISGHTGAQIIQYSEADTRGAVVESCYSVFQSASAYIPIVPYVLRGKRTPSVATVPSLCEFSLCPKMDLMVERIQRCKGQGVPPFVQLLHSSRSKIGPSAICRTALTAPLNHRVLSASIPPSLPPGKRRIIVILFRLDVGVSFFYSLILVFMSTL